MTMAIASIAQQAKYSQRSIAKDQNQFAFDSYDNLDNFFNWLLLKANKLSEYKWRWLRHFNEI